MSEIKEAFNSPEVINTLYDVVVVLGGNVRRTKTGRWVTTSYTEGKEKKYWCSRKDNSSCRVV